MLKLGFAHRGRLMRGGGGWNGLMVAVLVAGLHAYMPFSYGTQTQKYSGEVIEQ
jgi:hypothetical protein